jgi:ribose transport system ATP-binding protein
MIDPASEILFTARVISKSFPGVLALEAVDFDLKEGEVHALVGENGAGKSTLARIIAGAEIPDLGQMGFCGRIYQPGSRTDAESAGIRMIMQELHLIGNLTIAENILLNKLPHRFGIIDYEKLNRLAQEVMRQVGLGNIDPATPVRFLGTGQQQMVEIAAGLSQRCRILIMDEPTASLTDTETELLFTQIIKLKAEGVGIIYISHRIEEVVRITDRVTVLRDGKIIATHPTKELSVDGIIRMMVGRDIEHQQMRRAATTGKTALRVIGLTRGDKIKDITFEVHKGEILGVAGLMGSGRTEMVRALFGADDCDSGQTYLGESEEPLKIRRPKDAVRNGIVLAPEDRKEQGLLLGLAIRVNISLARLSSISRFGWINVSKENNIADKYADILSIRCSSGEQIVGQLSGGNQQKVVIAKWLHRDADIFCFDEPTRGIDVGAKFEIYQLLADLAGKAKAVIVISSELMELMAVCDRIMVMSAGRITATYSRGEWSQEKIMSAAFSGYINKPAGGKTSSC